MNEKGGGRSSKRPPWILLIHEAAAAELEGLSDEEYDRVRTALLRLADDPFRPRPGTDIKKLKDVGDEASLYRIRIGTHRALYAVVSEDREINILVIENRELGYDRLTKVAEARYSENA